MKIKIKHSTLAATVILFVLLAGDDVSGQAIIRVNVSSNGVEGDSFSRMQPSISRDGRLIAFTSHARNLVENDTNGIDDVFLHDRSTRQTLRASVGANGEQASGESPALSADGRWLAFVSFSTNLVPGVAQARKHVYVKDLSTSAVELISKNSSGIPGDSISGGPSVSGDGRYIAFVTDSRNLVPGLPLPTRQQVYVHDRQASSMRLISTDPAGAPGAQASNGPHISENGRHVAFGSAAPNLVPGFSSYRGQVFVYDMQAQTLEVASVNVNGGEANGTSGGGRLSANGRYVTFWSYASDLVAGDLNQRADVFVRDRTTGVTELISRNAFGSGNDTSESPSISADGRFVAFATAATNLAPGTTRSGHILVRDRLLGRTWSATLNAFGGEGAASFPVISADGGFVAFQSPMDILVPGDHNQTTDDFVADLGCSSWNVPYGQGCFGTSSPPIGQIPPVLQVAGCPSPNSTLYVWIKNARPSPLGVLISGELRNQIPIGLDCNLLMQRFFFSSFLVLPIHEGRGGLTIPIPANALGNVTLQALLFDPTVPLGLRATNGVEVQVR